MAPGVSIGGALPPPSRTNPTPNEAGTGAWGRAVARRGHSRWMWSPTNEAGMGAWGSGSGSSGALERSVWPRSVTIRRPRGPDSTPLPNSAQFGRCERINCAENGRSAESGHRRWDPASTCPRPALGTSRRPHLCIVVVPRTSKRPAAPDDPEVDPTPRPCLVVSAFGPQGDGRAPATGSPGWPPPSLPRLSFSPARSGSGPADGVVDGVELGVGLGQGGQALVGVTHGVEVQRPADGQREAVQLVGLGTQSPQGRGP